LSKSNTTVIDMATSTGHKSQPFCKPISIDQLEEVFEGRMQFGECLWWYSSLLYISYEWDIWKSIARKKHKVRNYYIAVEHGGIDEE
jgi:hypothetical protein